MSFNRLGSISINSSLCSNESDPLAVLAVSISFLQASPLNVLRIVHINDRSGSCPSSMSGKYFISSGSSFTNFQICFTLSSLYLGIGSWVLSLCFIAYYSHRVYLYYECLPAFFLQKVLSRKMLDTFQKVVDIAPLMPK